jgi:predicted dehydrogenase
MQRRRDFIRLGSAAFASVWAAPFLLPSRAFGGSLNAGPNSRINIGLIGLGKQMTGHRMALSGRPDVQIIGVCDVDGGRRELAKSEIEQAYAGRSGQSAYSGCKTFEDFRELLALPGLDAVVIATPDHWHSIIAIAACRAGKDVYCEKPLVNTIREGRTIVEVVKEYGTIFQVGSQQRSEYSFRFASQLARSGYLGDLKEVWVAVPQDPARVYNLPEEPIPPTLNWDFWCGPSPKVAYNAKIAPMGDPRRLGFPEWRQYFEFAGGNLTDWTPHHPNIVQWALGFDETGPTQILPPGDDVGQLTWVWKNGLQMKVGMPFPGGHVAFVGTKGTAVAARSGFLETTPASLANVVFRPDEDLLEVSTDHFGNWFDCIRTRRQPICPVEAGHRSACLGLLGNLALRFKRPITWDPDKETLVGTPELLPLLSRTIREPWSVI